MIIQFQLISCKIKYKISNVTLSFQFLMTAIYIITLFDNLIKIFLK